VYGIEFSPDNSKLFSTGISVGGSIDCYLFQYNLNAGNGNLDSINASLYVIVNNETSALQYYGLQIGTDNKIYKVSKDLNYLSVVNNPNNYGISCNYQKNFISLIGHSGSYNLPNFIAGYDYSNTIPNCIRKEIAEEAETLKILITPNPASNYLTIEINQKSEIEISNIEGQIIKRIKIKDNKTDIDISDFSSGVYIVRVQTDRGITTEKFVKE
jgi:hypothetical protein